MITNELVNFIKAQRLKGISDGVIKKLLIENGWTSNDIEEAIISLNKNRSFFRKPIGRARYIILITVTGIIQAFVNFNFSFNHALTYFCFDYGPAAPSSMYGYFGRSFDCFYNPIQYVLVGLPRAIGLWGILGFIFLPFIALKIIFTYKRLIAINKKWYWLVLYFIPLVNVFFVFYLFIKKE